MWAMSFWCSIAPQANFTTSIRPRHGSSGVVMGMQQRSRVVADLVADFAVEPSAAESDVMSVLEQLRQRGLIIADDPSDDGLLAQEMLPVRM